MLILYETASSIEQTIKSFGMRVLALDKTLIKYLYIIVLPQVLSTTRLVLITSCTDQNLSTIRSAVANYLRLLTHCSLNILIIS